MKKREGIIAFIVTAILLTALIPDRGIFKYDYQMGGRWNYETLTAPFDFPILKSEKQFQEDLRRVSEKSVPVYLMDTLVSNRILEEMRRDFRLDTNPITPSDTLLHRLYAFLQHAYRQGVRPNLDSDAYSQVPFLLVVRGMSVSDKQPNDVYTIEQLLDSVGVLTAAHRAVTGKRSVEKYIIANLSYDRGLSDAERDKNKRKVASTKGFVAKGTLIVSQGELITAPVYEQLESYRRVYSDRKNGRSESLATVLGNFLFVLIVLTVSFFFLFYFRKGFTQRRGNVFFLLFIYVLMVALTRFVSGIEFLNVYMIPFAIIPFFIITFYDLRMSIFEFVSILTICAVMTNNSFELFFINMFAGLAGVLVSRNVYLRGRLMMAAGVILVTYILSFVAVALMQRVSLSEIEWGTLFWFLINSILFLAFYQLIYLFERVFGFVTNITLFELCDTNQPLLKELALKAPGTFQHSIQVSNLAEAAAEEIGANPIYARAGALYHDIGKSCNELFFIENVSGNYSPHKDIDPLKSAEIIKKHITDGIALAKKHKLPSVLVDFIATHHGTSMIYFFYRSYIEKYDEKEVDISLFTYNGPLPVSKEAGICMMADAVEAASRSMKQYNQSDIVALVDKIIETQIEEGQFADSLLSFAEITRIKKVFVQKLTNIYHTRVVYPER